MKVYVVIRLRGTVKAKKEAVETLRLLRLNRKMHCVVIPETSPYKGMLFAAKDYITWGEVSQEELKKLVAKRGRKIGDAHLNEKEVDAAVKILGEGKKLAGTEIKPVFRLTPPSKGFKNSIKQHWPDGELGYRGKEISKLLERMI